jgi:PAS domain S-box-containing protein
MGVLRASPTAAAVLDERGRVRSWNEAAEQLLRRPPVDAIGRPLAEILTMPAQLASAVADRAGLDQRARDDLRQGVRLLAACPDDVAVPIILSLTDGDGGTLVAWMRSTVEAPVHQPNPDVFRTIFERAPEAITILDADLHQRSVNPAGLDLVGLPPGLEDVGQGSLYVHPDDQGIISDRAERRRRGLPVPERPVRYRVAHSDGSWRWLESLSVDLRDVPSVKGFVVLSRDVTEDEEQRIALEAATERLNQLDRSRNHLLSAVSHELRTPLTAIVSASEHLASDPVEPDELRAYAELIRRNAGRLDALVADLLLIGRLQNGTLPVELGPVDVAAVVGQVAAAHDQPGGPTVAVQVAPGPPVCADPDRLTQVLENLVTNALKFGDDDGAVVTARPDDAHWTISVSDRGPGIAPELLERVFEPFFRAPATERRAGGSGLGLAITRGIVDVHGGGLSLLPGEHGGTTATVTLPIWRDEEVDDRGC